MAGNESIELIDAIGQALADMECAIGPYLGTTTHFGLDGRCFGTPM